MMIFSNLKKYGLLAAAVSVSWLAGCASPPPATGASQQAVLAQYGKPTAIVDLPNGKRLQYSTQPFGRTALMVDMDASGRVTETRQVLNATDFARVRTGQWTRDDILREYGSPASIDRVGNWAGDILTYRWGNGPEPMLFYVYLDASQVVQQTVSTLEYRRSRRK